MGLFRITLVAALVGIGLGVALAYVDVGRVEESIAPTPVGGAVSSNVADPITAQPAYPVAEVDERLHDFGTMERGATLSHAFRFTNSGDAPLRLDVGQTTCKCTVGEVDGGPIQPGKSTTVRLEWVAKVNVGQFQQTATIRTNDPRQPEIDLKVTGWVTDTTGLEPEDLLLGQMTADDRRTASVWLVAYGETPLEATARMGETTRKPELYDLRVEPVEDVSTLPLPGATSGVRIYLDAGPGLPIGVLNEWVEVSTNLAEAPLVRVPVLAQVDGDVSIHGRGWAKQLGMLIFGKVRSDQGKEAKLLVSFKGVHATNATVEVEQTTPDWLDVQIGQRRAVRDGVVHFPMSVRIPSGRAPVVHSGVSEDEGGQGEGDAWVVLRTNSPETPEIDFRVRFIIIP